MNKKIETLTPEQEVLLQQTIDRWLSIGRSCEPIDMQKAEEVITEFYAKIGKPKPKIVKFDSPYGCMIAASMSKWDQLRDQLRGQLRDQLNWNYFAGAYWSFVEVFYKFCNQIGVEYTQEQTELLDLWIKQSEILQFWWPMDGLCVISERPEILNLDEAGRLHNPNGPAIRYRDGWSVYTINGVRMPEKYFTQPVTPSIIDSETNVEIQRKLIERYGLQKYIEDSGAKKIAEDEWGILYYKEMLNDEPIVMVSVLNSTPEEYEYEGLEERLEKREFRKSELGTPGKYKRYMLRVPPDTKTPLQGLAWMANMSEEEYAELDCES